MPSLHEIAIQLLSEFSGQNAESLELKELKGGINSNVFCVKINDKPQAVLKKYPIDANRDRQVCEINFLKFLDIAVPKKVPRLLAYKLSEGVSLIEWIDGAPNPTLQAEDYEQFSLFQMYLDKHKLIAEAKKVGLAADAVLCPMDLVNQLHNRLAEFSKVALPEEVKRFLFQEFKPFMDRAIEQTLNTYNRIGVEVDVPLPRDYQTLIASDFGTHNAVRKEDDELVFIDFEFAGWDDPITSIANFMLHPGMSTSFSKRVIFERRLLSYFSAYPEIKTRYMSLLPLFGLRWCLIILNIFRRNITDNDIPLRQREQWDKSMVMFENVKNGFGKF